MHTTGKFTQNLRIILAIAGKDITDAVKNKTTISVMISALFLLVFYILFPIMEEQDIIRLYDSGNSSWLPALQDSQPFSLTVYDSQEKMQYSLARRGERDLGLVLPVDFDQAVSAGNPVKLQGYLLNWLSDQQASALVRRAEQQLGEVVGTPVEMDVQRLFMLPETTGIILSRSIGTLLVVIMCGMVLVPHLLLEEKRTRTLDALMVSPASSSQIALGKALAGLFFCLLGFAIACLLNYRLVLHWGITLLAGILLAMFAVTLGLLLGSLTNNRQQLMLSANFSIFPLILVIFLNVTSDLMPGWVEAITRWIPTVAAFDLLRLGFTPQADLAFIATRTADILLFTLLFFVLLAWKIRRSDRV